MKDKNGVEIKAGDKVMTPTGEDEVISQLGVLMLRSRYVNWNIL